MADSAPFTVPGDRRASMSARGSAAPRRGPRLRKPAPEGESPAAPKPAPTADETPHAAAAKAPAKAPKRGWKRPLLFALLPVA